MTTVESGNFVQHGVAMQLKIGSWVRRRGNFEVAHRSAAYGVGEAIARAGCITITGGCPGLPFDAARGAKAAGGVVVGISLGLSLDEPVHKYRLVSS